MKHALVTGGAGFIGSHLVDCLLADEWITTVLDNFDDFYDPLIKRANIEKHLTATNYRLVEADIRDAHALDVNLTGKFDVIIHLAGRAGVRPSIAEPDLYQDVNVHGTLNLLEFARKRGIGQFVFASSSSVYGINPTVPWSEENSVLRPISPYAATKVAGELFGHAYSHLYGMRFLALRFFTVYGPKQRPDLAIHKFARQILEGRPITVFGDGSMRRDYTYVGDIVDGIRSAMSYDATPYEVINLGNNRPVILLDLIRAIENAFEARARINYASLQAGDVPQTFANIAKARDLLGFEPRTTLAQGLTQFADWMRDAKFAATV
jgi:UDP-glucuronate 4-epimerase